MREEEVVSNLRNTSNKVQVRKSGWTKTSDVLSSKIVSSQQNCRQVRICILGEGRLRLFHVLSL